jgi:tetratricopeptide (TPR) repeat protein
MFLVQQDRIGEVKPLLDAAEKLFGGSEDVFGSALQYFVTSEEYKTAEKFAASEPLRMKTSAEGNLAMGRLYAAGKRYTEAQRAFNIAAQVDKEWALPHIWLAHMYRKLSNWNAALKSAQQAISLEEREAEAHYQRACALARLGRIKDAMSALEKAVELDPDQAEWIVDEQDLKALSSLPAFKKLIPPPEKP